LEKTQTKAPKMNNSAYITKAEVEEFIEFFADKICGKIEHSYLVRQTGEEWSCKNIKDAALNYRWPWRGSNNLLCDSVKALRGYQSALLTALASRNAIDLRDASIDVFRWGGVLSGNKNRVTAHAVDLPSNYTATESELNLGGDDSKLGKVWNMNAGFSKVYSLLSEGMIIYDSRVGAALGYLVKRCATENDWETIPEELLFPYAPPRNSETAVNPLNRDPGSFHGVSFPSFSNRPYLHSVFMLRASWIINAVIEKVKCIEESDLSCNGLIISKHRFIEAGLFMIGYDLPKNEGENAQQTNLEQFKINSQTTYPYSTLGRNCEFNATLDKYSIQFEKAVGSKFEIDLAVIQKALLWLAERYGNIEFFPLDVSAELPYNNSENGLGTAINEVSTERFNPPDGSCIASLLTKIGVLEWNGARRGAKFRIKLIPTLDYLVELLEMEFSGGLDDSEN
jgi:hypothetical protein